MRKKLLSAVLVTTMLFLSACNSATTSTTKGSEEPGKATTEANETNNVSENDNGATTDPSGKYTYTVYSGTKYETKITLNVDIDKYLRNDEGESAPFFRMGRMANDLGWYTNGDPNYNGGSAASYYTYSYGDTQMVYTCGDNYKSSDNSIGQPQMGSFIYHLAPKSDFNASARSKDEIKTSHKNYGINVIFGQHSADLCYRAVNDGTGVSISRNDAIILAYVISSAISHPGENPFFGTNLDNAIESVSDTHILYRLP